MQSWPCMRWKRTQMSVWTVSMMWPRCSGPLAYGSALVTRILRGMKLAVRKGPASIDELTDVLYRLELGLVDALLVGLFAGNHPVLEQLLDGIVHGAHAELAAGVHCRLELVG